MRARQRGCPFRTEGDHAARRGGRPKLNAHHAQAAVWQLAGLGVCVHNCARRRLRLRPLPVLPKPSAFLAELGIKVGLLPSKDRLRDAHGVGCGGEGRAGAGGR